MVPLTCGVAEKQVVGQRWAGDVEWRRSVRREPHPPLAVQVGEAIIYRKSRRKLRICLHRCDESAKFEVDRSRRGCLASQLAEFVPHPSALFSLSGDRRGGAERPGSSGALYPPGGRGGLPYGT